MLGGICVQREGGSPLWRVSGCSAMAIRMVLAHWHDPTEYFGQAKAQGYQTLAVLDRDAFEDWNDWRGSIDRDLDRISGYIDAGIIDALAIGNEWDDGWRGPGMHDDPRVEARGGVSSWVMPFAEIGELVARVADRLYGRVPLILGGMSSGQPAAIDGLDLSKLAGIGVHPYGKRPATDWPDPNWGTGDIGWLLDPLRARLDERGLTDSCRMMIAECGANKYQSGSGLVAEWYTRMLNYLSQRGDVDSSFIFCDSDHNVDGYGVYRYDESPEPSVAAIAQVYTSLPPTAIVLPPAPPIIAEPGPWPEPEPPIVEPPPEDASWWDQDFSAAQILYALTESHAVSDPAGLLASIEANWPEFGPWLSDAGLAADVPTKLHILATTAVETAWEFEPIDEYGGYSYFESNYGPQTSVGQQLGNLYVGDGARYHGRGFIQLTGRNNYRTYGGLLSIDLESEPDEAKDPIAAAGVMVLYTASRNIPHLANTGQWELCRRAVNGGLNGYGEYLAIVQALSAQLTTPSRTPEDTQTVLGKVFGDALRYQGVPYVWGGSSPSGMDCSGFIAFVYSETLAIDLPHFTDAIYDATDPLDAISTYPGDIVLYEYFDAYQPGVRFPHVGFVSDRTGMTLDARGGVGVGYHANVGGAVCHYRRVRGLSAIPVGDPEEAMWREKYIVTMSYVGDDVADQLEVERAQLDDYGPPPAFVPAKPGKPTKAELQAQVDAMNTWATSVTKNTDARYVGIGAVGETLRDLRATTVGPRP